MKIKLGNKIVIPQTASVLTTINTGADEFNFTFESQPDVDKEIEELIRPGSLADTVIEVNNQKVLTGYKYVTERIATTRGISVRLAGYSKTYPLIMSDPPVQREILNSSLRDISKEYCDLFGILVKNQGVDAEIDEKFDNVKIGAQTKIFSFLQDLARQRGILTSCDNNGNLLYLRADANQKPVGSLTEGINGVSVQNTVFDDTTVFQNYIAINDSPFAFVLKDPQGVSKNIGIRVPSFKAITMNSLIEGAAQKAVEFTRNQNVAKSTGAIVDLIGWNDPHGELWTPGKLVSLTSETAFMKRGKTLLIVSVQYNLDSMGETTVLNLADPALYAGGEIDLITE